MMCVVIHAAKIIHKKGKMQIIGGKITILSVFFMRLLQKCDKRCNSPSKIEGAGGSMKALTSIYNIDYQPILHYHTPPPFGHLLYLRGGVLIRFRSFATLSPLFLLRALGTHALSSSNGRFS